MAPQIIYLVILGINLLLNANLHGQRRSPHNFWVSLIGASLAIGLLYWGGFFDVMIK